MKYIYLILAISISFFVSCKKTKSFYPDISSVNINPKFVNFHKLFFESDSESIKILKKEYPYLFPKNVNDSIWTEKIKDIDERRLYEMSDSVFGDFKTEKKELTKLFKLFRFFNPNFKAPKTITLTTNLDYENKVIYADSLLFISLDMYLGKNSEVYSDFPSYISNNYTKKQILVDVAKNIAKKEFIYKNGRTFLETMIYHGKELFILEALLPDLSEIEIIGFETEKYNWALENESKIWSYIISKKLLYSTDKNLRNRFINKAPFSKFYLETDRKSPGKIGVWIGWKIVKSFAKNNTINLKEILLLDAETIFRKSKYKPKK